jgi:uncharacterized membrane protein
MYPFAVYFMLGRTDPVLLVITFAALCILRLLAVKNLTLNQRTAGIGLLVIFCSIAAFDAELRMLKLYPVAVNAGAAGFCLYTLLNPPSAIERLSRMLGMQIEGPAKPYTRRLTMVWAVFFVSSALAAAYTALFTSTAIWALYNGLISYLLIGLLIVAEYPVRLAYRKRHNKATQ